MFGLPPQLSDDEIARYLALGREGWDHNREGNRSAAIRAFQAQTEIYPNNPEPFAAMALVYASADNKKEALEQFELAVARGFSDIYRFENAEVWQPLKRHRRFLALADAVPNLQTIENRWPGWDTFYSQTAPESVARARANYQEAQDQLERVALVIGERDRRLWARLFDRVAATTLEAYVTQRTDAADFDEALQDLMRLYRGGRVLNWSRIPKSPAERLADVATVALERLESPSARASAYFAQALAWNSLRDKKGGHSTERSAAIRDALRASIELADDSPLRTSATIGLIRSEWKRGAREQAAAELAAIEDHATRLAVRENLGSIALHLSGIPEFERPTLDGDLLQSASLTGQVTVLDFWATWCAP